MKKWVPVILGWMVFAAGALNLSSALLSRPKLQIVPLEVSYASRTTTILAGMFLIYLAGGVWNRKSRAWWLTLGLLMVSFVSHILKGLDLAEGIIILVPVALLLVFRDEFSVGSGRVETLIGIRNAIIVLIGLLIYSTLGFYALQGQFSREVTWQNIERDYEYSILGLGRDTLVPRTRQARWFESSISIVGIWSVLGAFGALFAPIVTRAKLSNAEMDRVYHWFKNSGNQPLAYFGLMPDKHYYGMVAYTMAHGVALALGGPINEQFSQSMTEKGLVPAFYGVTANEKQRGWRMAAWGEIAEIEIAKFDLAAAQTADVRHAVAKINREKIVFRWFDLASVPWSIEAKVNKVYADWIKTKMLSPLAFSTNFFPLPTDRNAYLEVGLDAAGNMLSVISLLPYDGGKRFTLDLMIRTRSSPNGIMEAALAEAIRFCKERQVLTLNLGMVALVGTGWAKPVIDALKPIYNYRSLYFFKHKFDPVWIKTYIAYKNRADLPKIGLAAISVHLRAGR